MYLYAMIVLHDKQNLTVLFFYAKTYWWITNSVAPDQMACCCLWSNEVCCLWSNEVCCLWSNEVCCLHNTHFPMTQLINCVCLIYICVKGTYVYVLWLKLYCVGRHLWITCINHAGAIIRLVCHILCFMYFTLQMIGIKMEKLY